MSWETVLAGVIAGVITGILLRAFDRALEEGYLKRAVLVVECVFFCGFIAWLFAYAFFYTPSPSVGPRPVSAAAIFEATAYVLYNGMSPFGRLLMAAGALTGVVLGVWYPEQMREVLQSGGKKGETSGGPEQRGK